MDARCERAVSASLRSVSEVWLGERVEGSPAIDAPLGDAPSDGFSTVVPSALGFFSMM
jgi:hypothetical protein